ncbi:MAG: NDP-sugar synthase [Actinobacteria bacterium]|nr:NDP-sugar synthase [Actinomycetota bacterium]
MAVGILLVGGFGTRLMPLTRHTPKPMLPVAGLPVTEHQLAMARSAGITTVVLATSYLSEVFIPYFGDGSEFGMKLLYAVEKEPLGTGGAIRNAADLLGRDESIVIFNGDVLSSHNLRGQIDFHEKNRADVTLHLTNVEDARAYGCVPTDSTKRVTAFLEKMENPPTNTINAGCYVFSPSVIDEIAPHSVVSIERETFPHLVSSGKRVFGYLDQSYWLDIGTPKALMQGSRDLVSGVADAPALRSAKVMSHSRESVVMDGAQIDASAMISGASAIGSGVFVGPGAVVDASIICSDVIIGEGASITHSFIASGTKIEKNSHISGSYCEKDDISSLNS